MSPNSSLNSIYLVTVKQSCRRLLGIWLAAWRRCPRNGSTNFRFDAPPVSTQSQKYRKCISKSLENCIICSLSSLAWIMSNGFVNLKRIELHYENSKLLTILGFGPTRLDSIQPDSWFLLARLTSLRPASVSALLLVEAEARKCCCFAKTATRRGCPLLAAILNFAL